MTGFEYIPWFITTNMNGRLYDQLTGMFLSPDNYVQSPGNSQNFNRYAYCMNNPLKYKDPSGYEISIPNWWVFWYIVNYIWDHSSINTGGSWNSSSGISTFSQEISIEQGNNSPQINQGEGGTRGGSLNSWEIEFGYFVPSTDMVYDEKGNKLYSLPEIVHGIIRVSTIIELETSGGGDDPNYWLTQEGGGTCTLDQLSSALLGAEYIVILAEDAGYNSSVGVWRDLSKFRYYPSGWRGSNQYVWKTFGVTKSLGFLFYTGGTVVNLRLYQTGKQSGLETGLNMGVSTISLIVGGIPGIGISGGYEYLKYMWNNIIDYGNAVHQLYLEKYQEYLQGTPYEIPGQ